MRCVVMMGPTYRCHGYAMRGRDVCYSHGEALKARGTSPPPLLAEGPYAGLTVRLANCLRRAGLARDDVAEMSDEALLKLRNVGAVGLRDVRAWAGDRPRLVDLQ